MKYRRLALGERYQIRAYLDNDLKAEEVAHRLSCNPSSIRREIVRNSVGGIYSPELADSMTVNRIRTKAKSRRKIQDKIEEFVREKIEDDWSPEQIDGSERGTAQHVSYSTIYRYLYSGKNEELCSHLRTGRKRRKKRSPKTCAIMRKNKEKKRRIEDRPQAVETRERIGDWERDTIVGKYPNPVILTLIDRRSRLIKIAMLENRTTEVCLRESARLLSRLPILTLTNDNGVEFRSSEITEQALKVPVYFCDPYASWQRGSVENANGLLRQYFPRDLDFNTVTRKELEEVEYGLNNRPRKCLGYQTPLEVLNRWKQSIIVHWK